jgi:rhodanese-related sulfurtransferase
VVAKEKQILGTISPQDAVKLIEEHKDDFNIIILDVRTPWEFSKEHIEGAENLDCTDPEFKEQLLELDKEKKYIVYCKSGVRGDKVLNLMKNSGFTEVYNVKGGFKAWEKS